MTKGKMIRKIENKILDLFLYNEKLKFNEIEKLLKIRSNKLAYHLKHMVNKGVIKKQNENYFLTEASEYLIPYLSEKQAVLPVILIYLGNKSSCFLYKRKKRPFKNKLSLPGGRLLMGESIESAVKRIMEDKFSIKIKLKKINSVSLEHVKKSGKIIHSFLLIFVSAETNNKISLTEIEKNKSKIISSDYKLIKKISNNLNIEGINIKEIITRI